MIILINNYFMDIYTILGENDYCEGDDCDGKVYIHDLDIERKRDIKDVYVNTISAHHMCIRWIPGISLSLTLSLSPSL